MFTDPKRAQVHDEVVQREVRLFSHLLTPDLFVQAAAECGLKIIRSPLNLVHLVWLALLAARHPQRAFADLLRLPFQALLDLPPDARVRPRRRSAAQRRSGRKHSPHGGVDPPVSDAAFSKARRRLPGEFWVALLVLLAQRFQQQHAQQVRWRRFRLLALDGTRLTLPDYPALRHHFGTANNGHGSHGAQARLVMLQFPQVRLPLAYALQPLGVGESTMARQLLQGLGHDDLVLLDAGFVNYGLLQQIQQQSASFCVRLRQRLNLSVVKPLAGPNDLLVDWTPKDSRGQWRQENLPRTLRLRLLTYQAQGFRPLQLLTNVLKPTEVEHAAWWGLSVSESGEVLVKGAYNLRWEIETSYYELKVGQQLQGGLRSRQAEGIEYEVAGHLLHYLLVRWLMVEAGESVEVSPLRLSFTAALRELSELHVAARAAGPKWLKRVLLPRLRERLGRQRVEERPGRSYPRKRRQRRAQKRARKATQKKQSQPQEKRGFGNGWNLQGKIPQDQKQKQG